MSQLLNIGILGTGFMGGIHSKSLNQLPDVTVAALCSDNVAQAEALRDTLASEAPIFDDFDQMLAETQLDALYICLPPFAHHGQAEKAAAQGLHLFVEKPIGIDVARAESITAAIEKAGVVSQVGHHIRFRKSVTRFKSLIEAGSAGRVTLFQGRYWCHFLGHSWWQDKKGSNGQVFEQVIHLYDLALHFLGAPQSVTGFMDNLCHQHISDYTVEDTSVSAIRFQNGSMANITGSNCALPGRFIGDFRVVCEKAALDYRATGDWHDKEEATLYTYDGDEIHEEHIVEDTDVYLAETEDFIRAIRVGGTTRIPIREGLNSVRLVSAVLDSAEHSGVPVKLDAD